MIYYFFAFVICLIGALINLPGVMNGSLISIAAMAFIAVAIADCALSA